MPLPFDPAELAMLTSTGFFGVSEEMLNEIAEEMGRQGLSSPSGALFDEICWDLGIDPANLTREDKAALCELAGDE